ncbi:MAG: RHS repeat-associated core domain-containing protein, partial [Acidobacteria bacterium]|nr:RHS repeat-associated core domain-containing protein [Acidobacteriota bacterium]
HTLPLGQVESYAYNSVGNLLSRTDFRGKVTSYSYDPMNRLLSKTPDASLSEPSISYSYNAVGQRASMSDRSGVTLYTYDARNRLTSKQTPQGTLTYAYDAASNLLSTRSSNTNGVNTSYAYDALNRMSSVTDNAAVIGTRPGTGSSSLFYDEVGNLASFNTANGVTTSYTYNSLNRLTNLTSSKAATSLASYAYTLGAAGNRTSVTEANGRVASYSYDALYRLTNETITNDAVSANNGSITYSYDAVGNRLSRTSSVAAVPSTTSAVDGNDRLASDAYDNNGNTVSSPDSTTPTASNAYQYDFENRLVKLNASTPSEVSYVYDGDGNRVSKTVGTGASATTTRYLVDTNNATGYAQVVEELAVVAGVSSVQRVYVYGHTRLSQQQLIGGNWVASFYGYDGHGSVRYLTDASGAVTDSYTYDAFGVLIQRTGTTPNDYLYAGEQFDSHLGLYYNRARYLNQATGRFFSMDPFQGEKYLPVSLHKYTYVEDNPINNRDPKGLETVATLLGTFNVRMTLAAIAAISLVCTINAVASSEGAPLPNGAPCKLPKRKKRCFEAYPNHITREALLRQNPYYIHNSEAEALNVLRSLTTEPLTRGTTGLATGGPCSLSSGYVVGQHRNILKVRDGLSAGSIGMCPCCDDSSGDARIIDLYAVLNFKLDPKDDDKKPEPGDDFDVPPEWR